MSTRVVKKEHRFAFRFFMSILIVTLPAWGWEETFISTMNHIGAHCARCDARVDGGADEGVVEKQIIAESIRKLQQGTFVHARKHVRQTPSCHPTHSDSYLEGAQRKTEIPRPTQNPLGETTTEAE